MMKQSPGFFCSMFTGFRALFRALLPALAEGAGCKDGFKGLINV